MITVGGLLNLLLLIVVLGLVFALIAYVLSIIPVLAPYNNVMRIIVVSIFCLIVIVLLLQLIGIGPGIAIVPR